MSSGEAYLGAVLVGGASYAQAADESSRVSKILPGDPAMWGGAGAVLGYLLYPGANSLIDKYAGTGLFGTGLKVLWVGGYGAQIGGYVDSRYPMQFPGAARLLGAVAAVGAQYYVTH